MPVTLTHDELLDNLVEECAEAIIVVQKIKRFGWESCHPKNPIQLNNELLAIEMGHVRAVINKILEMHPHLVGMHSQACKDKIPNAIKWKIVKLENEAKNAITTNTTGDPSHRSGTSSIG